jgi:hypothetical protein
MIKDNKEVIVKSRKRKKSPQISLNPSILKKSAKKSIKKKSVNKSPNALGVEKTLLQKYNYNVNSSDSDRKRSLSNAVIVYDPKGLYEELQNLSIKNKSNIKVEQIIKKDSDFVKQKYFKLIM